jgi:hypothetical protein
MIRRALTVLLALALFAPGLALAHKRHHHHHHRKGVHYRTRMGHQPSDRTTAGPLSPADPPESSTWLTPTPSTPEPEAPHPHGTPTLTFHAIGEEWCPELPPLEVEPQFGGAPLKVPRVCRRTLLGSITIRMFPEAEVQVDAPVCEGLGSGCPHAEAWRELTVYEYVWNSLKGPRLGLVSDPRYLPYESVAESECIEPQPTPQEQREHKKPKPRECPAGPEWVKDDAATLPVLEAITQWTVGGQPLNEVAP